MTAADRTRDTEPRSYARSYAHVARSTSTSPLEEGATATRRWTRAETKAKLATASGFRYPSPDLALLSEVVEGYEKITGDLVRTPGKRNFVAACYRTHGPDFLPLVIRIFEELGTANNLLGVIRGKPPGGGTPQPADLSVPAANELDLDSAAGRTATAAEDLLPGLTYGEHNRPPFDPTSNRRYDLRPSNPDAGAFFSDQELGVRPEPSPTARAIGR